MQLAKVEETYEGLRELLLKEQLLKTCDKTLAMFVRERAPARAQQTAEIANRYLQVHGGTLTGDRNVMKKNVNKFQNLLFRGQCYICGAERHRVEDGMVKPLQQKNASQGRTLPTCQICQKRCLVASKCWQRMTATLSPGVSKFIPRTQKPHLMAGCIEPETPEKAWQAAACIAHNVVSTADGQPEVKLACGSTLPVLQLCLDQAKVRQAGMPVCKGRIFEKNVSVLRDTGCSSIVVKRSLVNDCNLTGKECMAVLIDGTVRPFPIGAIHVDTPYYRGDVEAMCMERPIYDLIIGNIQDGRSPQDPDLEWKDYCIAT